MTAPDSRTGGQAVYDALEATEQQRDMLDMTLDSLIEAMSPEAVARLPDDLLRKVFARLPEKVKDALHARLYPNKGKRIGYRSYTLFLTSVSARLEFSWF